MKKAVLLMVAASMTFANAQRSSGSASTQLIFNSTVVAGCAANLDPTYTSSSGATYNGTDTNPESSDIATGQVLRCQTGTGVTIAATTTKDQDTSSDSGTFAGGVIDTPDPSTVVLSGPMSLRLNGGASSDDNKTLDGNFRLVFTKRNIAGGNGDTYNIRASFTPSRNQFEPFVGDYSGTLNVTINY